MKNTLMLLAACLAMSITTDVSGAVTIFSDNFETGNLDLWTIGGRRNGTNVANVVYRNDSFMGHLYHRDFTEVMMVKVLDYIPNMAFGFDMEIHAGSGASSTSAFYSWGSADFVFLDSEDNRIGLVGYAYATSNHAFVTYNPYPHTEYIRILDQGLHSYSFTADEILSNITVDRALISSVKLQFQAYASGWPYSMWAEVWVDNAQVTGDASVIPAPGAILLGTIGAGLVGWLRRRRSL